MKNLLLSGIIGLFFYSCSGNSSDINVTKNKEVKDTIVDSMEERLALINKYSDVLYEDSLTFHRKHAINLLAAYEDYIELHSFQSNSKTFQFQAGELAKALNKPNVAIKHFNGLLERDPDHEKAPVSLFYKAIVIGDMLHDDDLAIKTYQEFITKYPDHDFVPSAEQSIKLQGKTLEEIVSDFEKNS